MCLGSKGWNVARAVSVAKIKNTYNTKYIMYCFKSEDVKFQMYGNTNDTVQPTLNLSSLKSLVLTMPPTLSEQKAIASVLSCLDDKIDLLHRQNQTLESMAQTLFRQWFIEDAGEYSPVTDFVEFNPKRKIVKGDMSPYLDMASLSTATFNPDNWYDREFTSGTKFTNSDTLLARITPCLENGKTAYVSFLNDKQVGWGSTEFIVMRAKEPLHPFFAYILARTQEFREYAEGCMAGSSGRQRVDVDHLKKFVLVDGSKEGVEQFNSLADAVTPQLHANMIQIKTLETLRDSLLPKLMSGEVRVSV